MTQEEIDNGSEEMELGMAEVDKNDLGTINLPDGRVAHLRLEGSTTGILRGTVTIKDA